MINTTEAMPKPGDQIYAARSGRFLGLIGVIARSELYLGAQVYEVRTEIKYELNQGPITYWIKKYRGKWVTTEGPSQSQSRARATMDKLLKRIKFLDSKGAKNA